MLYFKFSEIQGALSNFKSSSNSFSNHFTWSNVSECTRIHENLNTMGLLLLRSQKLCFPLKLLSFANDQFIIYLNQWWIWPSKNYLITNTYAIKTPSRYTNVAWIAILTRHYMESKLITHTYNTCNNWKLHYANTGCFILWFHITVTLFW